jgi:hypothetical protein
MLAMHWLMPVPGRDPEIDRGIHVFDPGQAKHRWPGMPGHRVSFQKVS